MTGSTISGTVAVTVTIGSFAYPGPVTITPAGKVYPSTDGANAIYIPVSTSHARLLNDGTIIGGYSNYTANSPGGDGVHAAGRAIIDNAGRILGGSTFYYENAGNGITLEDGGIINNTGFIGGGGGYYYGFGGAGVSLTNGGTVHNAGTIVGGEGGFFRDRYYSFPGRAGVYAAGAAAIFNTNLIIGGYRAAGVDLASGGALTNQGTIIGGYVDGYGVELGSGTTLRNTGTIIGGKGLRGLPDENTGGPGGIGVNCAGGATIINSGHITGGQGGYASTYGGGPGGAGVNLSPGSALHNNGGTITGGNAGFYVGSVGGAGVNAAAGSTIFNNGLIAGGISDNYARNTLLVGGTGVSLLGAMMTNAGTVDGGAGGTYPRYGSGGTGGIGVSLTGGATLLNHGVISGGAGGMGEQANTHGGEGGLGVYISGATLTTAGTISGGAGGIGTQGNGAAGDAIHFGTVAAALIIDPGAIFDGNVVASTATQDVLVLAGTGAGTLAGLGTQFSAFAAVEERAHADWTLAGANTLGSATQLSAAGSLLVAGSLQAANLTLADGTLTDAAGATIVIGNDVNAQAGAITVAEAATLSGSGAIAGSKVVVDGILAAHGGTLSIETPIYGFGTMRIDGGATLVANNTLAVTHVAFGLDGDASLVLAQPVPDQAPFPTFFGFGTGDRIDLENLKATSLTFANGTLTLEHGSKTLDTLTFSGDYGSANFTLASDHHGGTDILFVTDGAPLPDFAPAPGSANFAFASHEFWGGSIQALTHYATANATDPIWSTLNHGIP